jgi:hypothetical protein
MSVIKNIINSCIEKYSFDIGDLYQKEIIIESDDFESLQHRIETMIKKELMDLVRYGKSDMGRYEVFGNKLDGDYVRRSDIIDLFKDGE